MMELPNPSMAMTLSRLNRAQQLALVMLLGDERMRFAVNNLLEGHAGLYPTHEDCVSLVHLGLALIVDRHWRLSLRGKVAARLITIDHSRPAGLPVRIETARRLRSHMRASAKNARTAPCGGDKSYPETADQ